MKNTSSNKNMTNEQVNNIQSQKKSDIRSKPERFSDQNLDQPVSKNKTQHYDDKTGTVANGLG